MTERDWQVAICGALAGAPLTTSIIGWASHWNVYINLQLLLGGVVTWVVMWRALKDSSA